MEHRCCYSNSDAPSLLFGRAWPARESREKLRERGLLMINAPVVLRKLLAGPGLLRAPGIVAGLGAPLVRRAGFSAVYLTGAGVAVSGYGLPDIGLVTASEKGARGAPGGGGGRAPGV